MLNPTVVLEHVVIRGHRLLRRRDVAFDDQIKIAIAQSGSTEAVLDGARAPLPFDRGALDAREALFSNGDNDLVPVADRRGAVGHAGAQAENPRSRRHCTLPAYGRGNRNITVLTGPRRQTRPATCC